MHPGGTNKFEHMKAVLKKHSNWLEIPTLLARSNPSALFQWNIVKLKFVYDIGYKLVKDSH